MSLITRLIELQERHGYLTAGFNRQTTAALRDNALVLGNPISALAPSGQRNEVASR